MYDKVLDIIKNKDLVVPGFIFYKKEELGLSYDEIYMLIYIYNLPKDSEFDMVKISSDLNIKPKEILRIVNDLVEKNFIKLDTINKDNYNYECFNLEGLYNKVVFSIIGKEEVKEEKKSGNTLFDEFEKEFKRPLTPKEFQIINAWKEIGYTEELIILALKEASYNGTYSVAYIDKILTSWDNKGIKTKEDVEKNKINHAKEEIPLEDDDEYDWLNE